MKEFVLFLVFTMSGLSVWAQQQTRLSSGYWRGELLRTDGNYIVFNFEVIDSAGRPKIFIRNATERLAVDDISFSPDSVFIRLPFFDSQFRAVLKNDTLLKGTWIKRLAERDVVIPFIARYTGKSSYRFLTTAAKPVADITGRWAGTFFNPVNNRTEPAVGVFSQNGTKLTGSFMTYAGDYRFLEGVVDGDSLKLSGFDGGYALYYTARIDSATAISGGKFFSGTGLVPREWAAVKDASAKLETQPISKLLKPGSSPRLDFTFKDLEGETVSVNDSRFKGKVLIIQLLGSWCPNCMDETTFLNDIYSKYKAKGVEIIGLAYERTADFARSQKSVTNFVRRLQVKYPVLITPVAAADPDNASLTIPQLERIAVFPTTIFADRQGNIKKVHSGFNGPGTGADYQLQQREYVDIIESLLKYD